MEFFFELVPEGALTPLLHPLGTGAELLVRPACKGLFTLDRKSGRTRHLMVATVTGVAPFVSMVRTMVRQPEEGHQLFVLEGASRSWEFAYAHELEETARNHPWLKFFPPSAASGKIPNGGASAGGWTTYCAKYTDLLGLTPENTSAYLCGHPTMIENARGMLRRAGFPKESVKEEIYFVLKT